MFCFFHPQSDLNETSCGLATEPPGMNMTDGRGAPRGDELVATVGTCGTPGGE